MKVLVVYCHPLADSFTAAVHRTALAALAEAGHEVRDLDLYAIGFDPVLSAEGRASYHTAGANEAGIGEHLAHLRWCEALVFIYPTWWYGLPAMLKGWLDRVWVPHATFSMPDGNRAIGRVLTNIRTIAGLTSYGAPWWWTQIVGDPGRRTLLRGVRAICHPRCRTLWLAHYRMDSSTPDSRRHHLGRVAVAMRRL
ncbi:MAG: NAD(P)H-dependent oxidoreductase [Thalassobaculales bacterium]